MYNYKISVTADWHWGCKDDNKLFYEEFPLYMEHLRQDKPDAIIICGDWYHRILKLTESPSKYSFNAMYQLNEYSITHKIPLIILKGTKTHDNNQLNNLARINNPYFKIINTVTEDTLLPGLKVLYVPEEYIEDGYYDKYFNVEDQYYDIIFGHGMFDFAGFNKDSKERQLKNAPTFKSNLFDKISRVTLFGHVHNRQQKGNVYYIGSYSANSFDEIGDRGWILLNISDEELKVEYKNNEKAPKYTTINIDKIEGETDIEKMNVINQIREEYDYIRIISNSKDAEGLKALTASTNIKVQVKQQTETKQVPEEYRFVLDDTIDLVEKIKRYAKLQYDIDLDNDFINENTKED